MKESLALQPWTPCARLCVRACVCVCVSPRWCREHCGCPIGFLGASPWSSRTNWRSNTVGGCRMPDLSGRHPSEQTVGVDPRNRAHHGEPSVPLPSELFLRVLEGLERESPSSRNASCSRLPPMPACGRRKSSASSQQQRRTWNSARPPQICTRQQTSPFSIAERSKDGGAFYVPAAAPLLMHLPRARSGDDYTGVTNGLRDLSCTDSTDTHAHAQTHTDI